LKPTAYERWLSDYDSLLTPQVLDYLNRVEEVPSISIIVPIYHPDMEFLSKAVESVIGQSWHRWELILSVDGPHEPEVIAQIEMLAEQYSNVQVIASDQHGNIARATMAGVSRSTGAFLAFLDQDDLLHPDALAWVSAYLHARPTTKLIYTDEDKIEDFQRLDPFFKPDFSPEYLLCVNYINHLTVIDRVTFDKAGGLIVGTEGAQDWDLLLRASAQLRPDEISHIPKVLYHWRSHPNSTAQSYDAKPEVIAAQERVVSEQLKREGYELQWLERPRSAPIFVLPHLHPTKDHVVSIIIPTKDHLDDLRTCISSILASYYEAIEILVIDNASTDPATLAYLDTLEAPVRVIRYHEPFNFATMVNYGVRQAVGDLVLLLNNDTRVINPDWLTEMAALAERPSIGAVGAKLLYPDASVQHNGVCLGIAGSAGHYGWAKDHRDPGDHGRGVLLSNTAAVTGAALMVERRKYIEVQGLNPELAISFNDIELCLALGRAGYRSVVTPSATLYHFESKSRGYNLIREQHYREDLESAYFYRHWPSIIPNDPYYSPNCSLELLEMFEPIGKPRVQLPWEMQHVTLTHPSPHVSANDAWCELPPSGRICFAVPVDADQLPHWTSLAMTIFSTNRQWSGRSSVTFELELTSNGAHRSFAGTVNQPPEDKAKPVTLHVQEKDASPELKSSADTTSNWNTPAADPNQPTDAERFDEALTRGYPVTATLVNPNDSPLYLKCVDLPSGLAAAGTTNVVPYLVLGLTYRPDEHHILSNATN
jgi:GT2 family glycosyltransferase